MPKTQPLKWHGGKSYLAHKLIALIPEHIHYVEPFFGGGAVLFRKDPEGVSEVVNDLDGELMNFWTVIGTDHLFDAFAKEIQHIPFSEPTFEFACTNKLYFMPEVGRALAFFIRYRQSRQGRGKCFATMSTNRVRRGMNEQVSAWLTAVEGLPEAHARLKRVVIYNKDACEVIRQQDGPNTFFYCDPPYMHETRAVPDSYTCEMSPDDHARLLATLASIEGKFLLSGYDNSLYRRFTSQHGWSLTRFVLPNHAGGGKTKRKMTECVWANYPLDGGELCQ